MGKNQAIEHGAEGWRRGAFPPYITGFFEKILKYIYLIDIIVIILFYDRFFALISRWFRAGFPLISHLFFAGFRPPL